MPVSKEFLDYLYSIKFAAQARGYEIDKVDPRVEPCPHCLLSYKEGQRIIERQAVQERITAMDKIIAKYIEVDNDDER